MSQWIRKLLMGQPMSRREFLSGTPDFDKRLEALLADPEMQAALRQQQLVDEKTARPPEGEYPLPNPDMSAMLYLGDILERHEGSSAPLTKEVFDADPDAPDGFLFGTGDMRSIDDFMALAPYARSQTTGNLPPRGSETGMVDPHLAIEHLEYGKPTPQVRDRFDRPGGVFSPRKFFSPNNIVGPGAPPSPWLPFQVRTSYDSANEGWGGYHKRVDPSDRTARFIDIAGLSVSPGKTAAHEMRHAITNDRFFDMPRLPGVMQTAERLGMGEVARKAQLDRPVEVIAYSADAIPKFWRLAGLDTGARQKLPRTDADVDTAMSLLTGVSKEDALAGNVPDTQHGILQVAALRDPEVRSLIKKTLTTGFAAAPVVAASAGGQAKAEDGAPVITNEELARVKPEGIPILSPEELAQLRAEFPDADPAVFAELEQASGFVSGDIAAEGVEFSTAPSAPSRIEESGDRRLPDWNTGDSRARQRLENYYSAVTDAMQQPVISVRAAAEQAAMRMGLPEEVMASAVARFERGMADAYPDGFMSPADFLREINVQPYLLQAEVGGLPDRIVQRQLAMIEEGAARQAQAVADQIGQKSYDPGVEPAVSLIRQAVVDHAPKGRYAAYAHRTASENAAVANAPFVEDANYRTTKDGAQNHRALRVAELFSAGDEGYAPGTGFSQFARGVGGTFGPMINRIRGVSDSIDRRNAEGTAWDDMREIGSTYGNFGYAANLYNAAGQGDPQEVYAADGTAKYYAYDPTNVYGLGQSMYNTSFPMARMYNNTAPVREAALYLGNDTIPDLAANLRRLRRESRAITPVVPDGFDPQQHREMGERLEGADTRMDGYLSAAYGPKFADAWNATAGRAGLPQADRTYMSPAFSTLLSVPGESLSDPINLGFNLAVPGIGGALVGGARGNLIGGLKGMAKGSVKGAAKGVATAPARMLDDTVEEMVENNVIGPTTTGFSAFFQPEKDNLLMAGWGVQDKGGMRQGTPNDEGYDEEVERRHQEARQTQYEVADAYGKARKQARAETTDRKPGRPVAEVRW